MMPKALGEEEEPGGKWGEECFSESRKERTVLALGGGVERGLIG